jgi:predicted nucleic acid-binding protein
MKVSLDTNILVQDFWLDSPHSRLFLDELNIIPATLHIPEVVIDEIINKYREFLVEKIEQQKKFNADISRLLKKNINPESIDVSQAIIDYGKFLFEKLKSINAEILPYPSVEHKEVVRRILERRKPFKKGDAGYRDYLIWETIKNLELWGTEQIVFITNNTKDFGDGGYLSAEFTDKNTDNKNFKIVVAVAKFNDEFILPRLKKLDKLKFQLSKGQASNFNFKEWLDTEFVEFIKETELEEVIAGFPYGVGKVKIVEIVTYDDYKIEDVSEMESGEKFIRFAIKCLVNASVGIEWKDYVNHKEVRKYYGEAKEEFGASYSMVSEKMEVGGFLILDKNNKEVSSFEITLLEGPKGSIQMDV